MNYTYVSELPEETINELKSLEEEKLREEGLDDEAIADALEKFINSKISDIDWDLSEDDDDESHTEHHSEVTTEDGLEIETEDKDEDGDIDCVTIEKEDPVDNNKVSEGLAGEMTPEEELMLKLMGNGDAPHDEALSGETTPEEDEMLAMFGGDNKTNSIANTLANYRW